MAANPYKRLPGIGRTLGSYTRLYQAADHLLQTSVAVFTERYKRFYFRDIQALIILRTQTWVWELAACGAVALVLVVAALLTKQPVATGVLAGLAAVFVLFGITSAIRGPTCRCYIRTAVQTERIPSLRRVRRAEKTLVQLRPLIEAAQVQLPTEQSIPTQSAPDSDQSASSSLEAGLPS